MANVVYKALRKNNVICEMSDKCGKCHFPYSDQTPQRSDKKYVNKYC